MNISPYDIASYTCWFSFNYSSGLGHDIYLVKVVNSDTI